MRLKDKVGQVVELEGKVEHKWVKDGKFHIILDVGDGDKVFVSFPGKLFKDQGALMNEFEVGETVELKGKLGLSNNEGKEFLVFTAFKYEKVVNNNNALDEGNLNELDKNEIEHYKS